MTDDTTLGGRVVVTADTPGVPEAPGVAGRVAACAGALRAAGHLVEVCAGIEAAGRALTRADQEIAVVLVTDPDRLAGEITSLGTGALDPVPIVAVGVADPVRARSLGAAGICFVVDDATGGAAIHGAVNRAVRWARALRREARFASHAGELTREFGSSEATASVHALVARAALVDAPILLIGEVGSGKRLVARAIHGASPRRGGPFMSWPVGAVAPEGVRSVREVLFGTQAAPGALESAEGGTLLVDEVALIPEPVQPALLDLLAVGGEPRATRADGSGRYRVDVRIIAGASVDLRHALDEGLLREDLYQRLRIFPIEIPPLRLRPLDIPGIADTLVQEYAARFGRPVVALTPEAVALLQAHDWPGNIRELQEHIERAVRRAAGPALRAADLAELAHRIGRRPSKPPSGTHDVTLALDEALPLRDLGRRAAAAVEIVAIRSALRATQGNVTHAAQRLGVSRIHLQKRMKLYGLRDEDPPRS